MSDANQTDASVVRTSPSAGRLLAAARAELKLSLEEVAERLNLGVSMIDALEQDAYERLPNPIFARGYLRAYAKLLKLDEEEIVNCANFDATTQVGETLYVKKAMKPKKSFKPRRELRIRRKKYRGVIVVRVLLIAGILVGLAWVVVDQVSYQLANMDMNKLAETLKLPVDFFDRDNPPTEFQLQPTDESDNQ